MNSRRYAWWVAAIACPTMAASARVAIAQNANKEPRMKRPWLYVRLAVRNAADGRAWEARLAARP